MSLYFDTSALAKLVVAEAESSALREWVGARREMPRITNSVGVVELRRLAARIGPTATDVAVQLLARVDQLDLTPTALRLAAELPPPQVRTLDALHIASAAELLDLDALVSYDIRLLAAAQHYGLPTTSPGRLRPGS